MERAHLADIRPIIRQVAVDMPALRLVYLFGSQVTGRTGPMSDYDFALLAARSADAERVQMAFVRDVSAQLGEAGEVDVVLLHRAPIELAYAVISQGQLLFERDLATRVEYEAYVLGRYGDYLPVLRRQRREIVAGGDNDARIRRYRAAFRRTERTLKQITAVTGKESR
jgi:predicted nucleotidyltransferase